VLDELGYALRGFTKTDARPITVDNLRKTLRVHLQEDATFYH